MVEFACCVVLVGIILIVGRTCIHQVPEDQIVVLESRGGLKNVPTGRVEVFNGPDWFFDLLVNIDTTSFPKQSAVSVSALCVTKDGEMFRQNVRFNYAYPADTSKMREIYLSPGQGNHRYFVEIFVRREVKKMLLAIAKGYTLERLVSDHSHYSDVVSYMVRGEPLLGRDDIPPVGTEFVFHRDTLHYFCGTLSDIKVYRPDVH